MKKYIRIPRVYLYIYLSMLCVVGVLTFLFLNRNVNDVIEQGRNIELSINGKCAVIMDAGNGKILYQKNYNDEYPPASTAKVMTAVISVEKMKLSQDIIPSQKVLRIEPTIAGLKPGVKYKLEDLISAILIKSANDAAFVIAEAIAGSEKAFSVMMNEKAKAIGMKNSNFVKASGLPTGKKDSQYTTAEDLAILMRYAKKYKVILENISKKDKYITGSGGKRIYLKTHNKSLLRKTNAPWGKTGYTREAKRTFIGVNPGKTRIVFGLLQSNDLWRDIITLKDKGLLLYNTAHTGFIEALMIWIKQQRSIGKQAVIGFYR